LYIALAHAFFISCLFGVLSYFILLSSRSKRNALSLEKVKEDNKLPSAPPVTVQ
ncbi:heme A synthase, partial [Bacillus sp. JJ1474]